MAPIVTNTILVPFGKIFGKDINCHMVGKVSQIDACTLAGIEKCGYKTGFEKKNAAHKDSTSLGENKAAAVCLALLYHQLIGLQQLGVFT